MAAFGDTSYMNRYGRRKTAKPKAKNSLGASGQPNTIAAPPATAAAPPAPTFAALPPDPSYEGTVGGLGRQRDTTLSALTGQRTAGLLNYGYNEDSSGALAFDPSNPYSQAAQMKKRFDESRTGTGNRMAASGNLYAGSYQQGQDIVNKDQGRSEDSLQKALGAFLAGNTASRSRAQTDYEFGVAGAEADRIGRAASNPLYSPVDPVAVAPAPVAAKAAKPRALTPAQFMKARKNAKGFHRI